jgi:hypothetical protein
LVRDLRFSAYRFRFLLGDLNHGRAKDPEEIPRHRVVPARLMDAGFRA